MKIVGCDFHPRWQQIAVFDRETGEITEHKLMNGDGEAEGFYAGLPAPSLVGVEACGNSQWFLDLLQRLGAITKQGNRFMRQLLVEAVQTSCRLDEGFRKQYQARCHHKPKGVAKVAAARKLAVRLYWMLRQDVGYPEIARIESSSGVPLARTTRPMN